jgi:hypothetical protein
MSMPRRQPVERLERGAIGEAFEAPPFGFDRRQVAVDAEAQVPRHFAKTLGAISKCRQPDIYRRIRIPQRRQCRGACHSIHCNGKTRISIGDN